MRILYFLSQVLSVVQGSTMGGEPWCDFLNERVSWWIIGVEWQVSSCSTISWREHVTFRWDSDDVCFVLDQEEFNGTIGVIRIRKSNKDRQDNGQKTDKTMAKRKKDNGTNNDLQNTTQKSKDRATRNPLKTGGELRCPEMVNSSCSTSDTRHILLVTNTVISYEWGKCLR